MSETARPYGGGLETRIAELERRLRGVAGGAGIVASLGTFSLTADGSATSTTKTDAAVTGSSRIFFVPSDSGGWSVDGALNGITPGAGSFSISHQASTLTRSYNYIVINPA
jgi:hypothetical protein